MSYLIDTNVISELRKPSPDARVLAWFDGVASDELFISALTIGEIRYGIERLRRKDAAQAERLRDWLSGLLMTYSDHLVGVDAKTAEEWGRISVPDPLPVIDGLLAASAKVRGWALVTRDIGNLARTGVALVDPFGPDPAD